MWVWPLAGVRRPDLSDLFAGSSQMLNEMSTLKRA
jgi:hypothetical protein